MNFFYAKPTDWTPKEPFFAIKVANELHPCQYQSDAKKGKFEAFIYGIGWKKSKKGYEIPLFAETDTIQSYIDKYGKHCAFYAITGKVLSSNECAVWAAQQEFKVGLSLGFDYIFEVNKAIQDLNVMIREIYETRYGIDMVKRWHSPSENPKIYGHFFIEDLMWFRPSYSLMAYVLCAPHLDVVNDDKRLWKLFTKLYDSDKVELPCSPKDRLTFLFSAEVAERYKELMKRYSLTKGKEATA